MSFIIKYNPFFSVVISEQNSGASVKGFSFFPTEECIRRLNDFNLVFRSRHSGFEVFYSETPLIKIEEKIRLSFGFYLSNNGLLKKYGLTDTAAYQPGLYFDNLKPDGSIIDNNSASLVAAGSGSNKTVTERDTYRIYRQTFKMFDLVKNDPPAHYKLNYKFTTSPIQTIPVASETGSEVIVTTINALEATNYFDRSGPYVLKPEGESNRNVYLSEELGHKGVHGVIDIYWENKQPKNVRNYNIILKPK